MLLLSGGSCPIEHLMVVHGQAVPGLSSMVQIRMSWSMPVGLVEGRSRANISEEQSTGEAGMRALRGREKGF